MKEYIVVVDSVDELLGQIVHGTIVRCKECKHRPTSTKAGNEYYIEFPKDSECPCQNTSDQYYSWCPDDEWFCPKGERRTE